MKSETIDHLFRYHSGKMVSVLTRIFGLQHLDIIEDAVQDTFIKASVAWRKQLPDNPEAWLTQAAKNRVLDIFRSLKTEQKHLPTFTQGTNAIAISDLFLDTEIEDAQLRMIFTACHPALDSRDRISFALKTVSGFSIKEISSALLTKEETVKKRLSRARKSIQQSGIEFKIPIGNELQERLDSVLEVLYLIFNEGFHSNQKETIIRKDLCAEAIRLTQILLKNERTRTPDVYALCALMYFHSARLDSKFNSDNTLLDLKTQDRNLWIVPFIEVGNSMMNRAVETEHFSYYHYEAAIAGEHLRAKTFKETNWEKILQWYECLYDLKPMPVHVLTMAVICIQKKDLIKAKEYLGQLKPIDFTQRIYLYHGTLADYFNAINEPEKAKEYLKRALETVNNDFERAFLEKRLEGFYG